MERLIIIGAAAAAGSSLAWNYGLTLEGVPREVTMAGYGAIIAFVLAKVIK